MFGRMVLSWNDSKVSFIIYFSVFINLTLDCLGQKFMGHFVAQFLLDSNLDSTNYSNKCVNHFLFEHIILISFLCCFSLN